LSTAESRRPANDNKRWRVISVLVFSSVLNYLDRQLLPAAAPLLRREFALANRDYGALLSAFSLSYAAFAVPAGLWLDRIGLRRGIRAAVALWSLAGAATGAMKSLEGLLACRGLLGIAQAAGVPAVGKAIALYLRPGERALGHALSQTGLTLGAVLAPPLAVWVSLRWGWRAAFFFAGALGLLWLPVWNRAAGWAPGRMLAGDPRIPLRLLVREPGLWAIVGAALLSMTVYTLWSNWTTLYLVEAQGLSFEQTAGWAALPPLASNLGGLSGGLSSLLWTRRGLAPVRARMRVCLLCALLLLATALIPLASSPVLAVAGISLSFFLCSAWSVNLYSLPLDLYGAERAAFATSLLTGAYGFLQAAVSPVYGWLADRYGFAPLCIAVSVLPLAGWSLLRVARLEREIETAD